MNKRLYFFAFVAIAAMTLTTGCSRDHEVYQPSHEEIMANAEEVLGVKIDPNQDWKMTSRAHAKVSVIGTVGETYTVKIYSNDPLVDKKGYVLKKGEVENGGTFEADFEYPSINTWLVVGITDSHSFTKYKTVRVANGRLEVTFGNGEVASTRSPLKSRQRPTVPHMSEIPTSQYAKTFLEDAQEPNDLNINENYKKWIEGEPEHYEFAVITVTENDLEGEDLQWYRENIQPFTWWRFSQYDGATNQEEAWAVVVRLLQQTGRTNWLRVVSANESHWEKSENYADHFKIIGEWGKYINVLQSEGDLARTVYVSGKWTIPQGQTQVVGGGGIIVVDEGGEIEIPENSCLSLVNEARLIVMPGGKVSGKGTLLVTNGNATGFESYNGGTIDVEKFNNNYGKFFNYGKLKAVSYAAGAGESNIYNHGLVHINNAGNRYYSEAANARIFNACQWFCDTDMRAFIVESTQSSYFYVGGELVMSDGTDGTGENSYVALANGSLIRLGSLYNNNCDWIGPTNGFAVVEIGKVNFLNWTGDSPIERGFFINNIAVTVDTKHNNCEGKSTENAYNVLSRYVANGMGADSWTSLLGNGGVVFVEKFGAEVIVPRDELFDAGEEGCTPGYQGVGGGIIEEEVEEEEQPTPDPDPVIPTESNVDTDVPAVWTYAFEDTPLGDYDMNDVVIKVSENVDDSNLLDVTLCCAGASFDLRVYLGENKIFGGIEVHKVLGQPSGTLINTGKGPDVYDLVPTQIEKPEGFSFADADFWIESPAVIGGVHIAKIGEDPHGVVIPGDWLWPLEQVSIKAAYPQFARFASDVSGADDDAKQWYKTTGSNPVPGTVFR